jgi:cytochrome c biogenesis protein
VYTGFGLLMVGVMMSYVSHSQVWALADQGKLYLGGAPDRAQVTFEREILELLADWPRFRGIDPGTHPPTVSGS